MNDNEVVEIEFDIEQLLYRSDIPTLRFHNCVVPSMLAEASIVDCGLTLTEVTPYLCPSSGENEASVKPSPGCHSHTLTLLSLQ